jgi:hypothetical protein
MALKAMKKMVIEDEDKDYVTKDEKGYTMTSKVKRPEGTRYYKSSSPNLSMAQKMNRFKAMTNPADSVTSSSLSKIELEKLK